MLHLPMAFNQSKRFSIFLTNFLFSFSPPPSSSNQNDEIKGPTNTDKSPYVLKTFGYHSSSIDGALLHNNSNLQTVVVSIVNPQGTVTTVTNNPIQLDESFSSDNYIHENCDETMFRPVVTVISDPNQRHRHDAVNSEDVSQPVEMPSQLIVPVIDENMLQKKKKEREMEQQEKSRQQCEAEFARIAKQEEEEKTKLELEKAQIKVDEKPDVPELPSGAQKRGKKAQKYNKKSFEPERKPTERKVKEPSPPKIAQYEEEIVVEEKVIESLAKIELKDEVDEIEEPEKLDEQTSSAPEPIKVRSFSDMMHDARKAAKSQVSEIEEKKEKSSEPPKVEEIKMIAVQEKSPSPIASPTPIAQQVLIDAKPLVLPSVAVAPEVKEVKSLEKVEFPKPEPIAKKGKKGRKYEPRSKPPQRVEDDFPSLGSPPRLNAMPIDDHRIIDNDAIMKISMHETIGDDEIEIIPHENTVVIQDSPEKFEQGFDVELIDEHFMIPEDPIEVGKSKFIKNEDFYDIDYDLPPLEPLESFDINFEALCFEEAPKEKEPPTEVDDHKQEMKKKMSELLKDTNMIFAMCSSLKEIKEDDDAKSMSSSQIQRSTSSSLTTNTTTATFASASSNQTGEGQDSDYKSLELDMDDSAPADPVVEIEFKMPTDMKPVDDAEDISSFEATSSETDDSSKKSNTTAPKFKRDDDEELRPLLQTSITSLSSPSAAAPIDTTEANDTSTLPDINQKSSSQTTSNNGNGNKRKNKKKRR